MITIRRLLILTMTKHWFFELFLWFLPFTKWLGNSTKNKVSKKRRVTSLACRLLPTVVSQTELLRRSLQKRKSLFSILHLESFLAASRGLLATANISWTLVCCLGELMKQSLPKSIRAYVGLVPEIPRPPIPRGIWEILLPETQGNFFRGNSGNLTP